MAFKKGQSGNPKGRPKTKGALQEFRTCSYEDFIRKLQKYGAFTVDEMEVELQRTDIPMFDLMFAKVVADAATGNAVARSVILERLWGRVNYKSPFFDDSPTLNPNDPDGPAIEVERTEVIVYLPSNGREVGSERCLKP